MTQAEDPIARFLAWYEEVQHSDLPEPTAMVLATADREGQPSARVVLLKSCDERGFVFYTNLRSQKGKDLDENPRAALCFYWPPLCRQVRVRGRIERVDDGEADAYFASRPRESQLGAWASEQSAPLQSREALLQRFEEAKARFEGGPVPRPPYWTGLRVVPEEIELWEQGPNRLHHRELYVREGGGWRKTLLFP